MTLIRYMFFFTAQLNVNILLQHISGHINVAADLLSRLQVQGFRLRFLLVDPSPAQINPGVRKIFPQWLHIFNRKLSLQLLGCHMVLGFATMNSFVTAGHMSCGLCQKMFSSRMSQSQSIWYLTPLFERIQLFPFTYAWLQRTHQGHELIFHTLWGIKRVQCASFSRPLCLPLNYNHFNPFQNRIFAVCTQ